LVTRSRTRIVIPGSGSPWLFSLSGSGSCPQADGGLGGTGVELFEATEEIARADGSAGWCMLISNAISTFVHKGATAKALREVFGNGPVACWATLLPKAKSVEVKGGFRVSGNFAWGSSSSLSRWVLGRRAARRA
jgi:alkylation response protein AidB-like acyl-CoA dehydrogenase